MLTLIHLESCSKSQCLLQYLRDRNIPFELRDYLQRPLTAPELDKLLEALDLYQPTPAAAIVRVKDLENKGMPSAQSIDLSDRDAVIALLVQFAELLQRPLLTNGTTAVIGRPFERALQYLSVAGFTA